MSPLRFLIDADRRPAFRYFWLKKVVGFNPRVHCARCLKGEYSELCGPGVAVGVPIEDPLFQSGDFAYFCGVSTPYRWANNLHLAGRVVPGSVASAPIWSGGQLVVRGLEKIEFDDEAALRLFPEHGAAYLTCRNFQFGAQVFGTVG